MRQLPDIQIGEYASLAPAFTACAVILQPVARMSPSQAAEKYVRLRQPTGGIAKLDFDRTPYLREPLDMTADRSVDTVVLLGPAQDTGKTAALTGLSLGYVGLVAQVDCRIIQMSQIMAADFSQKKIDPPIRHSPAVKAAVSSKVVDDTTYKKKFKAGHFLDIGWPSSVHLASHSTPFMLITDADRMPQDVGGEGSVYGQAKGRIGSDGRGCVFIESTPGFDSEEPDFKHKAGSHELRPAEGIVKLYNSGDRRRWWWACQSAECGEYFHADLDDLVYPDEGSPEERSEKAVLPCPCCGHEHSFSDRSAMNASGVWVPEGCGVNTDGELTGEPKFKGSNRSYHVQELAASAGTRSWASLVAEKINAELQFEKTGDDDALKTFNNTRRALAHLPMALKKLKSLDAEAMRKRAEDWPKRTVPEGVRRLVASVDVNAGPST